MRRAQKRRHLQNALPIGTATKTWNERRLCLLTVFVLPPYGMVTLSGHAICGLWTEPLELEGWLSYKPWMLSYNHAVYQPFVYAQSCGQLFLLSTLRPLRVAMPHRGGQVYTLIRTVNCVCRPFGHSELPSTQLLGNTDLHLRKSGL